MDLGTFSFDGGGAGAGAGKPGEPPPCPPPHAQAAFFGEKLLFNLRQSV